MLMVIAYEGPTPNATPLTASKTAGSAIGQTEAGMQLIEDTTAPPMIMYDGFRLKHLQMQGATTSRLTSEGAHVVSENGEMQEDSEQTR